MFQSYALFPNLTVADNVAYGLVNRKAPQGADRGARRRAAQAGRPAGQRRQVSRRSSRAASSSASRWRARSPPRRGLLLLDEPLSALDALERVRLRQEIRSLQRKLGVTTIMVTHDQEEALSMADRIVVMNHGVIEQVGTPMEVYRDPATPFVADFVGKINVLAGRLHPGRRPAHRHAAGSPASTTPPPSATSRSTCGPKTCWRGRSRRATPTSSTARSTRSSSSARTAWCACRAEAIGAQPLTVYLSLNFLAEQGLEVGSRLPLRCCPSGCAFF